MKVLPDGQNDIPHIVATGLRSHRTPSCEISCYRLTSLPACLNSKANLGVADKIE